MAASATQPAAAAPSSRSSDLLVVVGPSGAGKSTLIGRLRAEYPNSFGYSISHTTRSSRSGEVNGKDYHFVDAAQFQELLEADQFLEHAIVHNTMYGTSAESVRHVLDSDQVATMDLDIVGAQNLKLRGSFKTCVVWVCPPSHEDLARRLRSRGTDSEEKMQTRLTNAHLEMKWREEHGHELFDACFVNDDLEECYQSFKHFVMSKCFQVSPGRKQG